MRQPIMLLLAGGKRDEVEYCLFLSRYLVETGASIHQDLHTRIAIVYISAVP